MKSGFSTSNEIRGNFLIVARQKNIIIQIVHIELVQQNATLKLRPLKRLL